MTEPLERPCPVCQAIPGEACRRVVHRVGKADNETEYYDPGAGPERAIPHASRRLP